MRTLGLDYGERRIGVAVSDPTGLLAQPLETIQRPGRSGGRGGEQRAVERVVALVAEYEVGRIVLGLPLQMDGREGEAVARTRAFGDVIARETGLPVDYVDERLTSREAERVLVAARGKPSRHKDRVDRVAAALVLQTWLERERGAS